MVPPVIVGPNEPRPPPPWTSTHPFTRHGEIPSSSSPPVNPRGPRDRGLQVGFVEARLEPHAAAIQLAGKA